MHSVMKMDRAMVNRYWGIKILLIVLGVFFLISNGYSSNQTEKSAFRDKPSVSIMVHRVQYSITAAFDIDIVFTNLTNKAFDISDVKILLPESILALRPGVLQQFTVQKHMVSEGSERIYRMNIPSVHMPFFEAISNTQTLLFAPGVYNIRAEVAFYESGKEMISQSMYATYELEFEPPLSAVLRGGVLGALLLALFVPAYRAMNLRSGNRISIKGLFLQSLIFFLAGSVVSITAILVLHRIGNLKLPITVAVNDYLGGVVIGLFSYSIGNTLYRQLFGKNNANK